jgi:hypothetical protein
MEADKKKAAVSFKNKCVINVRLTYFGFFKYKYSYALFSGLQQVTTYATLCARLHSGSLFSKCRRSCHSEICLEVRNAFRVVSYLCCIHFSQSHSHIATDDLSVCLAWCRVPSGAHNQIFLLVWKLLSFTCGHPLWWEDGSVACQNHSKQLVSCQYIQLFTFYLLLTICIYNIYKASVSPGSV